MKALFGKICMQKGMQNGVPNKSKNNDIYVHANKHNK